MSKETLVLKAKKDCRECHGSGTVTDWVDYGSAKIAMNSDCECIYKYVNDEIMKKIDMNELCVKVQACDGYMDDLSNDS